VNDVRQVGFKAGPLRRFRPTRSFGILPDSVVAWSNRPADHTVALLGLPGTIDFAAFRAICRRGRRLLLGTGPHARPGPPLGCTPAPFPLQWWVRHHQQRPCVGAAALILTTRRGLPAPVRQSGVSRLARGPWSMWWPPRSVAFGEALQLRLPAYASRCGQRPALAERLSSAACGSSPVAPITPGF